MLPDSIISVVLGPVVKDKVGKLISSDNYRPIALASVMYKVLETIHWLDLRSTSRVRTTNLVSNKILALNLFLH